MSSNFYKNWLIYYMDKPKVKIWKRYVWNVPDVRIDPKKISGQFFGTCFYKNVAAPWVSVGNYLVELFLVNFVKLLFTT